MTVEEVNEKINALYEKEMTDNPNLEGLELYASAYWQAHNDYILQEHQIQVARKERRQAQEENEVLKKKIFIQDEIIIGEQTENEKLKDLLNRSNVRLAEEQIKNEAQKDKIKELENDIKTLKESERDLKADLFKAREKDFNK